MTSPNSSSLKPGSIGGLKTRKASEESQKPCIMLYGDGGTGKTTLAASACEVEEMSPVLHLNIEDGAQSIEFKYPELDIIDIETIAQLQKVCDHLHAHQGSGFKTVILDNLTEGQSKGLDHILTGSKHSTDFTDFEGATFANGAWNRSSEQMRKMIRYFRDLPMNVIFIAWRKDFSPPNSSIPEYRPAFTKTFAGEAPGMVNDVYHYYVKGGKRVLQTSATDRAVAKDRTNKLPLVIENPTMQIIHDYWTGKLVKPEPATAQTDNGKLTTRKGTR